MKPHFLWTSLLPSVIPTALKSSRLSHHPKSTQTLLNPLIPSSPTVVPCLDVPSISLAVFAAQPPRSPYPPSDSYHLPFLAKQLYKKQHT